MLVGAFTTILPYVWGYSTHFLSFSCPFVHKSRRRIPDSHGDNLRGRGKRILRLGSNFSYFCTDASSLPHNHSGITGIQPLRCSSCWGRLIVRFASATTKWKPKLTFSFQWEHFLDEWNGSNWNADVNNREAEAAAASVTEAIDIQRRLKIALHAATCNWKWMWWRGADPPLCSCPSGPTSHLLSDGQDREEQDVFVWFRNWFCWFSLKGRSPEMWFIPNCEPPFSLWKQQNDPERVFSKKTKSWSWTKTSFWCLLKVFFFSFLPGLQNYSKSF